MRKWAEAIGLWLVVVSLWIGLGLIAYSSSNATRCQELIRNAQRWPSLYEDGSYGEWDARGDLKMARVAGVLGPVGLVGAVFYTGFFVDGFRWDSGPCDWEVEHEERVRAKEQKLKAEKEEGK